jgi:hypothetical protein
MSDVSYLKGRKFVVNDGRCCWLMPDGSNQCITELDGKLIQSALTHYLIKPDYETRPWNYYSLGVRGGCMPYAIEASRGIEKDGYKSYEAAEKIAYVLLERFEKDGMRHVHPVVIFGPDLPEAGVTIY